MDNGDGVDLIFEGRKGIAMSHSNNSPCAPVRCNLKTLSVPCLSENGSDTEHGEEEANRETEGSRKATRPNLRRGKESQFAQWDLTDIRPLWGAAGEWKMFHETLKCHHPVTSDIRHPYLAINPLQMWFANETRVSSLAPFAWLLDQRLNCIPLQL